MKNCETLTDLPNLLNIKTFWKTLLSIEGVEDAHDCCWFTLSELEASVDPAGADEGGVQLVEVVGGYHHHTALYTVYYTLLNNR